MFSNYGNGFHVAAFSSPVATKGNIISQNRTKDNGNYVMGPNPKTGAIGIDLVATGGDNLKGVPPFVTLNSDVPPGNNGGNNLNNFPVVESAEFDGTNLHIKGFVRTGQTIEIFKAHNYPNGFNAQGELYITNFVEGSSSDLDNTTGSYSGTVNGKNVGTGTNVDRFYVILPTTAFAVGDSLTTTATGADGTSEFSPAVVVIPYSPAAVINPICHCKWNKTPTSIAGNFGYTSSGTSPITILAGPQNNFTGTALNAQPTVFNPGTNNHVFDLEYAGGSASWTVQTNTAIANGLTNYCPQDLHVQISASNVAPNVGDNVTVTVTITNNTGAPWVFTDGFITNIELTVTQPGGFVFVSASPSTGSYSGFNWSVPYLAPGASATLTLVYTVNSSGVVSAVSTIFDQYDIDLTNNFAAVNIATGSSSSGGSGGIESFGGLSQLLSQRNMQRLRDGKYTYFENIEALPAAGTVGSVMAGRGSLTLADLTPVSGPEHSTGKVVTPSDLIGITNAIDVYSVDYIKGAFRLGSVLALESPAGKIYDHTKVVCDRLTGARMPEIRTVSAAGRPFLMALLEQENGEIDYNITFVMYIDENENFTIDNKWNLSEYEPKAGHRVFNMQVWSVSPHTTIQMVEDIIHLARSHGNVQFLNTVPAALPTVFVESGYYKNGKLHLKIQNNSNATRLTFRGLTASTETEQHVTVFDDLPLPEGQQVVDFEFPIGFAFDAGFSIANNATSGLDQIYVADGAWGVDYELTSADKVSFEALPQTTELSKDGLHFERSAVVSAQVKEYFSVFRVLLPGAYRPMDLTKYSNLIFNATVKKATKVQVVVVKRGISNWAEQFRAQVTLLPGTKEYNVPFDELKSENGGIFSADDILSVVWVSNIGSTDDNHVEMTISDLKFRKSFENSPSVQPGKGEVNIFPNPSVRDFTFAFLLETESTVKIELINTLGQVVETIKREKLPAGVHQFSYQKQLRSGIYFVRIVTGHIVRTGSVVITE